MGTRVCVYVYIVHVLSPGYLCVYVNAFKREMIAPFQYCTENDTHSNICGGSDQELVPVIRGGPL